MNRNELSYFVDLISMQLKETDSYITDDGLFCYSINEDNEVIIENYLGDFSVVNVPASINGLPVTIIGEIAFCENNSIETVVLPEVKAILPFAFFGCLSLKKIEIPKVISLGEGALACCLLLEEIDTPNVTTIEYYGFVESGIRSINLPKIISIGSEAFYPCLDLEAITLCKNLCEVGTNVFTDCPIKSATIDYGTKDISNVTLDDWNEFVEKLTGLEIEGITGKYVKNNATIKDLSL